jgi:hypothetical protein
LDYATASLLLTGSIAVATVWGRVSCRKKENFGARDCLGKVDAVIVTAIKSWREDNHWQMPAAWCGRITVSVLSDKTNGVVLHALNNWIEWLRLTPFAEKFFVVPYQFCNAYRDG